MPKGKVGFIKNDPNCSGKKLIGQPSNFTKNKPWREAVNRVLLRSAGKNKGKIIDALARSLISAAHRGDVQALKEIGDRIDGKPITQVEVKAEGRLIITATDAKL